MGHPYYPWYPKDFAGDTHVLAMTNMQELIYRRLLDRSWELGSLPDDINHLARLSRVRPNTFRQAWAYPLTLCWSKTDGGALINQRLEDIRDGITERSESARDAAKIRWEKRSKRLATQKEDDANALRSVCQPKPNIKTNNLFPIGSLDPEPDLAIDTGLRSPESKGEPRSLREGDDLESIGRRYLAALNSVQERRIRKVTPDVAKAIKERIKDGWEPWRIVAVPILAYAQRPTKQNPDVYLRNGEHPRTRNGNTYGGYYWLARTYDSADGTKLNARLTGIAEGVGVLEQLTAIGVVTEAE